MKYYVLTLIRMTMIESYSLFSRVLLIPSNRLPRVVLRTFLSGILLTLCLVNIPAPLQAQEYKRNSSLVYLDQLVDKIKPSLKRFTKNQNFQGRVAFTGLTGIGKDIGASEKNHLTSILEKLQFKKSEFRIVTSVEAFNKTISIENRYRLNFKSGNPESAGYARALDSEHYMLISIDYGRKVIGMGISIFSQRNNRRVWSESVSIYFEERLFNYELGALQSIGYDFSFFLSNYIYAKLSAYVNMGLYFSIGYSFINRNQVPQNLQKIRYLAGLKFAVSLLRPTLKEYKGFDLLFAMKAGIDGNFILGDEMLESEIDVGTILGTVGLNFFIKGRVSINLELDVARLATGLINGLPANNYLLGFTEISYHF